MLVGGRGMLCVEEKRRRDIIYQTLFIILAEIIFSRKEPVI